MGSVARAIAQLRGAPIPDDETITARAADAPVPLVQRGPRILSDRSEAEIVDALLPWLRIRGWEVYCEVPLGSGRPDIVGWRTKRDGDIETLAIEAKLVDIASVIRQGKRAANLVDVAYIALPRVSAKEASRTLRRLARRRTDSLPGVISVSHLVLLELDPRPSPEGPSQRVSPEELQRRATTYGRTRGGVPSTDQTERNCEIWREIADGRSIADVASAYHLSVLAVRDILDRLNVWRDHLSMCDGQPCVARDEVSRRWFRRAHKYAAELLGLAEIPPDALGSTPTEDDLITFWNDPDK